MPKIIRLPLTEYFGVTVPTKNKSQSLPSHPILKIGACFFACLLGAAASLPADAEEIRNLSNRRYFEETLHAIEGAQRSIFFVMYHLPLDPSNRESPVTKLVEALVRAQTRGVRVEVILDQERQADPTSQAAPLKNLRAYSVFKENGVAVSFDSLSKRTHAKLLVIDEEKVIIGSANWSREALNENNEANLLIRSPGTARALLEDFKSIDLFKSIRGQAPYEKPVRISRGFLLDKAQGPRFLDERAERAFRLHLYLGTVLRDSSGEPSPIQTFDYEKTARLLGLEKMSPNAYRRQIIKVLKKLDKDYGLIHFEPRHGKEARVSLADPAVPTENYFEIPSEFFSAAWFTRLSMREQYALLVLYDQLSYPRTSPVIDAGLETLEKRYGISVKTLGQGLRELAREDLVEIHYRPAIDFARLDFQTANYLVLGFYDPKEREEKLKELELFYGKDAFRRAQKYAGAFFKEKNPDVIETILGLELAYSRQWLDLAMKKVILKKSTGNPARSLPYLIGILKEWKQKGRPTISPSV